MSFMNRDRMEAVLETAVILGALATIPLTIALEAGAETRLVVAGDWAVWTVFVIEYLAMLHLAQDKRTYVTRNWLSLVVIVVSFPLLPALLALSRIARLTRVLRVLRLAAVVTRGWRAFSDVLGRRGFLYMTGTCVFLVLAGAGVLALAEPSHVRGYGDAVWWAVVTTTTVGYGDIIPVSPLGRFVAVLLMVAGLGLVATLAASIAAHFVEQDEVDDEARLAARLDRLEALLRELVEDRRDRRVPGPDLEPGRSGVLEGVEHGGERPGSGQAASG